MNYLFGNSVLAIEGDENIYSVVPFTYDVELVKNTGYLKDGYVYIYRGDVSRQKKYKSGLFNDKKGNIIFAMSEDEKEKYSFVNVKDDSIHSILEQAKKVNPKLKKKIMKEINKSSDVYVPELDENDDFLKHLVKLILQEKKIDLKAHKDKFKKTHDLTNIKASLETKTSPDGKRGSLTMNNLLKWLEILEMDIEVIFKDSENSEDPCFKKFKYDASSGYSVEVEEGYEDESEDDECNDEE